MRKPADTEEIVLIAVLRVLNHSQDDVSSILGMSKIKVNETDRWLKEAPIQEVRRCLDDRHIREVVARDLPYREELERVMLAKALQVTVLQILARYRADWKPADAEIEEVHRDELRDLLKKWIDDIRWPGSDNFPPTSGGPGRYRQYDYCLEVLEEWDDTTYPTQGERCALRLCCGVEDDPLFASLMEHLQGNIIQEVFCAYKRVGGQYLYACDELKTRNQENDWAMQDGRHEFSTLPELEEVEHLNVSLSELRRLLVTCIRRVLDVPSFPGVCSRCGGGPSAPLAKRASNEAWQG